MTGPEKWVLQRGDRILDWKVLQPLNRGGMSEVYLIERLSRPSYPYALKLFLPGAETPEFFRERFFALGEGLLQLSHPALAKLLYVGILPHRGTDYPYAVMTFIGMSEAGCRHLLSRDTAPAADTRELRAYSLADILLQRPAPTLDWLERWYRDAVTGLEHLHAAGFAHGDIKPTNLLIDAAGRAVLIDFGLATVLSEAAVPPGYEVTRAALQSSTLFRGTPSYTAPELLPGGSPTREGDWYSLGATFFFARTGVAYYPSAAMRLLIDSMESPWRERFQRLLCEEPAQRRPNPLPPRPAALPLPAPRRQRRRLAITLLSALLLLAGGAGTLLALRGRVIPDHPVLHAADGRPPEIRLAEGKEAVLELEGTSATLSECTVPESATLTVSGPGTLQIVRNEKARLQGTLKLLHGATVTFTGNHPHTRPKLVTTRGTRITAAVGTNRPSVNQFTALDMSHGGTFTGEGVRFFLTHKEPNEIRLGNGAELDLPWVASRCVIRGTAGGGTLRGTNAHIWHSVWLYADAGSTLTLTGTRLFMYDYWRGEDLVVDALNRGTVIFDYDVMRPLCKFHLKGGTTRMRCDMIQSLDENWCQGRKALDWIVHPGATLSGATALTFLEGCALHVKPEAILLAGEAGSGTFKANRAVLEAGAVLKAPGESTFHFGHLTVKGPITLDLSETRAAAPLTWETLEASPETIHCINLPRGMRTKLTPTALTLLPEAAHEP